MSRILVGAATMFALVASPAVAQTEPVPTPPCPTSEQYQTVGLAGKLLIANHLLLPRLTERIVTRLIERDQITPGPSGATSGNLFAPMAEGAGPTGGWRPRRGARAGWAGMVAALLGAR